MLNEILRMREVWDQRMANGPVARLAELLVRMSGGRETEAVAKAKEIAEHVKSATDLVLHGGGLNAMREWGGWFFDLEIHAIIAQLMIEELCDHDIDVIDD